MKVNVTGDALAGAPQQTKTEIPARAKKNARCRGDNASGLRGAESTPAIAGARRFARPRLRPPGL